MINGLIVAEGRKRGIATPANEAMVAVTRRIHAGRAQARPRQPQARHRAGGTKLRVTVLSRSRGTIAGAGRARTGFAIAGHLVVGDACIELLERRSRIDQAPAELVSGAFSPSFIALTVRTSRHRLASTPGCARSAAPRRRWHGLARNGRSRRGSRSSVGSHRQDVDPRRRDRHMGGAAIGAVVERVILVVAVTAITFGSAAG